MIICMLLVLGDWIEVLFEWICMIVWCIVFGSCFVVVVDVFKDLMYQVNYGIGCDVSDELVVDVGELLWIDWWLDSLICILVYSIGEGLVMF